MLKQRPPTILLVEDNEDDVLLTLRALRNLNLQNKVDTVRDGAEAIEYLLAEGRYADRNRRNVPDLILLDINLPRMSGIEVLKRIRSEPDIKTVPVIMLTTSSQERDMRAAYEAGANSYIRKPVESEAFQQAINNLGFYWLAINTPPPQGSR